MRNLHELLQQTETLLNRGEVAEALSVIAQVKQRADDESPGEAEPKQTIPERIEALRGDLFGVQSIVSVTRDSIDRDQDWDRYAVLDRVYDELDAIATEMESIAGDVRRAVSVISDALLVQP